jgi:hypothetical protein
MAVSRITRFIGIAGMALDRLGRHSVLERALWTGVLVTIMEARETPMRLFAGYPLARAATGGSSAHDVR